MNGGSGDHLNPFAIVDEGFLKAANSLRDSGGSGGAPRETTDNGGAAVDETEFLSRSDNLRELDVSSVSAGSDSDEEYDQLGADGGSSGARDITGFRLLRAPAFWLIFAMFFVSAGSGLTFIDQLRQQVESVSDGGAAVSSGVVVLVLSVCNAAGRIFGGVLSDVLVRGGVARIFTMIAYVYLMGAATALLAAAWSPMLVLAGAALVGTAYGGLYALVPSLNSLLFGLKHFGQNQGWMVLAPGCGGFMLSLMTSELYDVQSSEAADGELRCYGVSCFLYAYAALAALNVLLATGGLACVLLTRVGRRIRRIERPNRGQRRKVRI